MVKFDEKHIGTFQVMESLGGQGGKCRGITKYMYCCKKGNFSEFSETHHLRTLGACTENLYVSLSAEFSFIRIGRSNNSTSANYEN